MSVESRPFAGTWRQQSRQVVKQSPDCLVYVNGDTSIPGCPSCGGKINLQPFITQVSVDPSTEGPATCSISLHIPRHEGDSLFRDANPTITPGLEVHVYLRGYFPARGLTSDISVEQTGGLDVSNAVLYPYYLVFHGVMTEVSHEYSGGEHTASISCADMLHFWQYQRMSTSGSAFGARPTNSKVDMTLVGHTMTGMSPYAIIYQLFRDVQGSAGGVEFALGNKTNASANSTVIGESLFSLSILYWQKRFSQSMMSLRMYGADGTLYNAFQAAFLASLKSSDPEKLAKKYAGKNAQSYEVDPLVRASRVSGFDPYSVGLGAEGGSGKEGQLGINVAALQAFTSDISQWGNVNFFETTYVSKLDIATNVKEACGFEFYQDVDGDLVFKPPFYNLDTSGSRVYRIEDIDIISFSASTKEPEATVVKATGGHFRGMTGFGLENNEWGTRAEFIDYRLVAKYGWRPKDFETTYHTNPQAMFFACVARFDVFNIGVNSASCSIPLRPELRPGYPVYVVPFDCFYYVHSMSHSFSFGGQCTTALNLVGRRAKFHAPGEPPRDGSKPTISNIRLNNLHLPMMPLEVSEVDGEQVYPRMQGFPNVVMTLDPELVNPLSFASGVPVDELQTVDAIRALIAQVRSSRLGVLQQADDADGDEQTRSTDGPFQIQTGQDTPPLVIPGVEELLSQARSLKSVYDNRKSSADERSKVEAGAAPLLALVEAARDTHSKMFPESDSSATYLSLLSDFKAAYNPGVALPGYYRYYSSAHPDPAMQGPATLHVSSTGIPSVGTVQRPDETMDQVTTQFAATSSGGNTLVRDGVISAGIPILKAGTKDQVVSTPTHQITTFQVALFKVLSTGSTSITVGERPAGFPYRTLADAYRVVFADAASQVSHDLASPVGASYAAAFDQIASASARAAGAKPAFPNPDRLLGDVPGVTLRDKLSSLTREVSGTCARAAASALTARQRSGGDAQELARAWASAWPSGSSVQGGSGTNRRSKAKENVKLYTVPVFPVSDERGYEVVGTYRYGRGLTLDKLAAVNAYTASGTVDYDSVEKFISDVKSGTDLSVALGTLDPGQRAVLASGTLSESVMKTLELSNPGGDLLAQGASAWVADSREFSQKDTVVNAAYSLADLQIEDGRRSVCSCRAAEADFYLNAFASGDFAVVSGETDKVQDWLRDQAQAVAVSWAATQDSYRGTTSGVAVPDLGETASGIASPLKTFLE